MKTFKQFILESKKSDDDEEYHRQFHDGLLFMAAKYKSTIMGAVNYYHLTDEHPNELMSYYNKHVLPLLKKKPAPHSKEWGDVQLAIRKKWAKEKLHPLLKNKK